MRFNQPSSAVSTRATKLAELQKLPSDESGATAIEFAAVIGPFLFLLFGIMSVGLYFFVVFSLEHAVETASRVIRTGQAQTQATPMTGAQFKTAVCSRLPDFMQSQCASKIRIHVQNFTDYTGAAAECKGGDGNLIPAVDPVTNNSNEVYSTGGASSVVLVTACFEWSLGASMANIPYWISPPTAQLTNGATLIRASATFTTEPYN